MVSGQFDVLNRRNLLVESLEKHTRDIKVKTKPRISVVGRISLQRELRQFGLKVAEGVRIYPGEPNGPNTTPCMLGFSSEMWIARIGRMNPINITRWLRTNDN